MLHKFIAIFVSCLFISAMVNFLLIKYSNMHISYTGDTDLKSVQKVHKFVVPRVGGLGIFLSFMIGSYALYLLNIFNLKILYIVCFGGAVFICGFLEDILKILSVKIRLVFVIAVAFLVSSLCEFWIVNLDISWLDALLNQFPVFSILFTCLAISGVTNSFNILDGFNGLSSGVGVLSFCSLAIISYLVSDYVAFAFLIALIAAVLGFMLFNFPFGKIFLGDGGAYLIGFLLASIALYLVKEHSDIIEWAMLLICIYAVTETVFTIFRRLLIHKTNPGQPDMQHMHHLIYNILILNINVSNKLNLNSLVSVIVWGLNLLPCISAIAFRDNKIILISLCVVFSVLYLILYFILFRVIKLTGLKKTDNYFYAGN